MTRPIPTISPALYTKLSMADLLVSSEARSALSYRLAIYVVEWTYYRTPEKEKFFTTNPMNTVGASLLRSGLEKAAIDIYSETEQITKLAKLKWSDVSGLVMLRNHRTYQAHRAIGSFNDKNVREFVEADQHFKDDVARRIWQVRAGLIQIMYKSRQKVEYPLEIVFGSELADIVLNIFRYSMRDLGNLNRTHIEGTFKLFAPVIEDSYRKTFLEDFSIRYNESILKEPVR